MDVGDAEAVSSAALHHGTGCHIASPVRPAAVSTGSSHGAVTRWSVAPRPSTLVGAAVSILVAGLVAVTLLSPDPAPSPEPTSPNPGAGTTQGPPAEPPAGDDPPATTTSSSSTPAPPAGPATPGVPTASAAVLVRLLEDELGYACADLPDATVVCDAAEDLSGRTEIRRGATGVLAVDSSASVDRAPTVLPAVARLAVPADDAATAGDWVRRAVGATGPEVPVATTAIAGVPFAVYGDGTTVLLDLG
jgi:hypothetical protein